MRQKLNLITLGVNNFKKSVAFYESLGWKKSVSSMDELALFPLGGITLALYPREELAQDANVKNEKTGFSGITLSFNAKSESEVDEVLAEAKKSGATFD